MNGGWIVNMYILHSDKYLSFFLSKVRITCDLKIMYCGTGLTGFFCYNSSIQAFLDFGFRAESWLLKMLQNTLKTDAKLREFIDNPILNRQLKVEGLKQVASKFPLSSQSSNLLGKYIFIVLQLFLDVQSEADWNLNNSYIFAVMSCLVTDFLDWHFS